MDATRAVVVSVHSKVIAELSGTGKLRLLQCPPASVKAVRCDCKLSATLVRKRAEPHG
jgi:hypothetical protein